jgi:large subunit ribosomal protein L13
MSEGATMKTFMAKTAEVERKWYVVDATGLPLGRLASQVAIILRGKHKPTFTPHVDTGDYVIIVNADKVVLKGNSKPDEPVYWHTGYPGGVRSRTRAQMLAATPERLVERVIKGMLPHNSLGRDMFSKCKVYRGAAHPHAAQQPEPLTLKVD